MTGILRTGLCLFGLGGLDLDAACRIAVQAGVRHVSLDLAMIRGREDLDALLGDPAASGRQLKNRLDAFGLQPVELFLCAVPVGDGVSPDHPDPEMRRLAEECFRRVACFTAAAGFSHVMGVPGRGDPDSDDWTRSAEMLFSLVATARDEGTVFTVEPHLGSLIDQPNRALAMLRDVPGLRITLDYAHFHAQGIPVEDVFPLHAHTQHLHAKQAAVGRSKTLWHEGTIPFDVILDRLAADGWNGVVSPEYIGVMPTPEQRPEEAVLLANPLIQSLAGLSAVTALVKEERN